MPRPKGLPKTGGRQKGAANKRTREIADRAATDAGLLPLDYMLSVVRDPAVEPERRDRMAVAAAPLFMRGSPRSRSGSTARSKCA